MTVYAVSIRFNGTEKLSQEAYSSLEEAHRFIKSRVPEPGRLGMMKFRDAEGREYLIHDLRVVKQKEKHEFWGARQRYFDSGKVEVRIFPVEAETKPENQMTDGKAFDEYVDYFDTCEEAAAWADQALKA